MPRPSRSLSVDGIAFSAVTGVLSVGLGAPVAHAGLSIISAERTVSALLDIGSGTPFTLNQADHHSGPGPWSGSVNATFASAISATASQVSDINANGIFATHGVASAAMLESDMVSVVANAISRLEVVFSVDRPSLFLLSANYDYISAGGVVPMTTPFLSVAGTELFLPEPEGCGNFTLTLALQPGTYSFIAITAVGGLVFAGGGEFSAASVELNYSFALIPAPASALLFALGGCCGGGRRRRGVCIGSAPH